MDTGHWMGAERTHRHLSMQTDMDPSTPFDGQSPEKTHCWLLWITVVWWRLLELYLFLLNAFLSTSSTCYRLTEMKRRAVDHQPQDQGGSNVVVTEDCGPRRDHHTNSLGLLQYIADLGASLLPHSFPPGNNPSMAEGKVLVAGSGGQMGGQVRKQSDMEFSCANPLILSMIWPDATENAQSQAWAGEEVPYDWINVPKGSLMDDGESSDWSSEDDELCDESDSRLLWDSFFQSDPYNPLNFSASTGHLACNTDTDKEEDSLVQFESENDKLWDSFSENTDPFNLLNVLVFTTTTNQGEKEGVCNTELTEEGLLETPGLCFNADTCGVEQSASTSKQETHENQRKTLKKVRFNPVVEVHQMIVWDFAYRAARKGPWEQYARDRSRFQRRIANTEAAIGFCLEQGHRCVVWMKLHGDQEPEFGNQYFKGAKAKC
ncbi:protein phosphatase 1 regulatory subunit 15B-like [Narcine bancroftii]|uniref:protein phosphatase 1 regulatory subunit 15B-like n=1 Tax=Narcine bancroftii TaxID=1343680 RepID=UPI00383130A8